MGYTEHHRSKDVNSGMITKISMSSDGSQMVAVAASQGYIMIREPGTSTTITTMTASTRTAVTKGLLNPVLPGSTPIVRRKLTHKNLDRVMKCSESTYTNRHYLVKRIWSDNLCKAKSAMNKHGTTRIFE